MTIFCRLFLSIACWIMGYQLIFNPPTVFAQGTKSQTEEPLIYSADQVTYDDLKQLIVLTGQVVLVNGSNTLKADQVELFADPEGYHFANAKMNQASPKRMATFLQINPDTFEKVEGKAFTIDYDGKQEIMTLKGQAQIKRLTSNNHLIDEIQAPAITYNARYEYYSANGNKDKEGKTLIHERVRGIFVPKSNKIKSRSHLPPSQPSIILRPADSISSAINK